MQIDFTVGEAPAEFLFNSAIGKAELKLGQETIELQNPLRPSSQFSFRLTKTWTVTKDGHEITIVKRRPLLVAGFRKSSFEVSVDGTVVAEATGR